MTINIEAQTADQRRELAIAVGELLRNRGYVFQRNYGLFVVTGVEPPPPRPVIRRPAPRLRRKTY